MGAVSGRGEIELEWYPNVMGYIKGVEKNAFAFCQYRWSILFVMGLLNWAFVLGFTLIPILSHQLWVQLMSLTCTIAYLTSIHLQMKKILDLKFWQVCFFPLAIISLPIVFLRAATLAKINKGIYWRGTFYSLDELKKNQRMKLTNLIFSIDEEEKSEEAAEDFGSDFLNTEPNLIGANK